MLGHTTAKTEICTSDPLSFSCFTRKGQIPFGARLPMAWEGEGPSGHPAEPERAVRDVPRLRGSVAIPLHVLSFSIGNLGLNKAVFGGRAGWWATSKTNEC